MEGVIASVTVLLIIGFVFVESSLKRGRPDAAIIDACIIAAGIGCIVFVYLKFQ